MAKTMCSSTKNAAARRAIAVVLGVMLAAPAVLIGSPSPVAAETAAGALIVQVGEGDLPEFMPDLTMSADGGSMAFFAWAGYASRELSTQVVQGREFDPEISHQVSVMDLGESGPDVQGLAWYDGSSYGNGTDGHRAAISADGLTVVANPYGGHMECDSGPNGRGNEFGNAQMIVWKRATRGAAFGDPVLASLAEIQPVGCTEGIGEHSGSFSEYIGTGADSRVTLPSVNADGSKVSFATIATNLAAARSVYHTLYVAADDGTSLEVVTPPGFDGYITEAKISGDGNHVVFEAGGSGLPGGGSDGVSQIYLATAPVSTGGAWTIDLISVDMAGMLLDKGWGPDVSHDGSRVSFVTEGSSAGEIEVGTLLGSRPNQIVVVRDTNAGKSYLPRPTKRDHIGVCPIACVNGGGLIVHG